MSCSDCISNRFCCCGKPSIGLTLEQQPRLSPGALQLCTTSSTAQCDHAHAVHTALREFAENRGKFAEIVRKLAESRGKFGENVRKLAEIQGRALYGPMPVKTALSAIGPNKFRGKFIYQSLVHTFCCGNSYGPYGPESFSKASPYTGSGPWMVLPENSRKAAEICGKSRKWAERGRTTTCTSGCTWQSAQTHPAPAQMVLIFVEGCAVLGLGKFASSSVAATVARLPRDSP